MLSGGVLIKLLSSIGEGDDILEAEVDMVGVGVLLKELIGLLDDEEADRFFRSSPE